MSQNGALPIYRWDNGKVHEKASQIVCNYTAHNILTHKGDFILSHPMKGYSNGSGYTARRGEMMAVMFEYFQKLGIELHTNADVREYFETEQSAGVVVNGQNWVADVVICADGVRKSSEFPCERIRN